MIRNLIDEVVEATAQIPLQIAILQRVREVSAAPDPRIAESDEASCLAVAIRAGEAQVAAGTVWAWARSVILLGDPQQLEQPIQGSHPPGCDRSALEHLLGSHDTVPADRGLFLPTTWRLHPEICAFTSELFYEGRLDGHPACAGQALTGPTRFAGAGLWLDLVEHEGNTSRSPEEVERIAELVRELLRPGTGWIDFAGRERALGPDDLRIISPYNAQVAALRAALPEIAHQIGTVDRFQGQEAPVVLYSLTTSSAEEAPRGLEFLCSLHRLNVATSRARCVCIVVASPALLDAECRTPRQMKLINALCRYRELARLA